MVLWRISNYTNLQGIGGTVTSGRWHHKGRPIVYLADCPATALLEVLVHFEMDLEDLPGSFTLLRVELPRSVSLIDRRDDLPEDWADNVTVTRRFGDQWLLGAKTLLLQVPTALVPYNSNYLFNPAHPDADKAELTHFAFPLDPRLFNSRR